MVVCLLTMTNCSRCEWMCKWVYAWWILASHVLFPSSRSRMNQLLKNNDNELTYQGCWVNIEQAQTERIFFFCTRWVTLGVYFCHEQCATRNVQNTAWLTTHVKTKQWRNVPLCRLRLTFRVSLIVKITISFAPNSLQAVEKNGL